MSRNPELYIWLQPVRGEALVVRSRDFAGVEEAVDAVDEALGQGRTLRFELSSPEDGESGESGYAVVNFGQVVAVKVWPESAKGPDDGQYL